MLNNPIILGTKLPVLADPAVPGEVLAGKQLIDANGNILTGTMPTKPAQTYIPSSAPQTILAGQYLSGIQTIQGDHNLIPENIKAGVTIFGINGMYSPSLPTFTTNIAGVDSISNQQITSQSLNSNVTSLSQLVSLQIAWDEVYYISKGFDNFSNYKNDSYCLLKLLCLRDVLSEGNGNPGFYMEGLTTYNLGTEASQSVHTISLSPTPQAPQITFLNGKITVSLTGDYYWPDLNKSHMRVIYTYIN